jgi:hypothetical protein
MAEINDYIQRLLASKSIDFSGAKGKLLDEFTSEEDNIFSFNQIVSNQNILITRFMNKLSIYDIIQQHLQIPNGTVNKFYSYKFDLAKLGNNKIIFSAIESIEQYGLNYNHQSATLSGTPLLSGDFKINFQFKIDGEEEDLPLNLKPMALVINADPKSLWKDIPSTQTANNYWKEDNTSDFKPLGDKHIVVASKRGRSHANVGSFRDDDYAFKHFENTGWSVVCVADGAGSAALSRQGSLMACNAVIDYFNENFTPEYLVEFDQILANHHNKIGEDTSKKISHFVYNNLSKAALCAHKKIEELSNKLEVNIKDFHSTLIFTLFKKYEFGYAILSFGVGDCPIGLLNKDLTEIKLMNWLDVGEFGGGTRFITMPEIFSSDKFATRFGFKLMDDFSYLMLMTDGIYDPKFVVEANLEKLEKWQEFINDLSGNNDEKIKVDFKPGNHEIANQLSAWMDFWSPGNHDDRTLAIIF